MPARLLVLTNEKSEKSEKAILTPSSGPQRNVKQLFLVLTQSEKSLLAYTAHTQAKKKWYVSGPHLKISPQIPFLQRLYDIKIIKVEEIKSHTWAPLNTCASNISLHPCTLSCSDF
jgi:hypothetical protein